MTMLLRRFGEQSILPLLKVNLSRSGLIVAFLGELYRTIISQPKELQSAFRTVLEIFIPSFRIPQHGPLSKRRRTNNQISSDVRSSAFLPDVITAEELATLIGHCEMLRLDTEIESLLKTIRIKCTTGNFDMSVYESFLVPILTYLLPIFAHRHIQLNTARYRKLYQTICVVYTQQYVGPEPTRPANWTRAPRGCHLSPPNVACDYCAVLDKFLANPEQTVIRFATEWQRRRHIEDQLKDQFEKHFLRAVTTMTDPSKPIVRTRCTLSEYMLVITKTEEEWRQDLSRWKVRRAAAKRNIEAIGKIEVLQSLLSDENGLVTELQELGLFEPSQATAEPALKPLAVGIKSPRTSEWLSEWLRKSDLLEQQRIAIFGRH